VLPPAAWAVETPPPTPVPPDGKPSPFVTDLKTPEPSSRPPSLSAPAAVLADLDTGQILLSKGADERRPIASLTKLMTALLVLERSELDDVVTVSGRAAPSVSGYHGSELDLRPGEHISVDLLLHGLLIQSSNDAAIALAEHVAGSVDRFVGLMNRRGNRLGMTDTRFSSPNGLDDAGYSTAADLLLLTEAAYEHRPFARIVQTKFFEIPSPQGPAREITNRNVLLWLYQGMLGVKTGYTVGARFCLVGVAQREGLRLVTVVLGAPREPFSDSATLLNHGFETFERRTFVEDGQALGPVSIEGGQVQAAAGEGLEALAPSAKVADATTQLDVDAGAAFPPVPGEAIGIARVRVPGLVLGEVPMIVSEVPPPPPPEEGPWWRRTVGSLVDAVGGGLSSLLG
jgi:serine-type D-Ala-D-Ala carboxypeptidase (penicillin-binding protein 5/6)